MLFSNFSMPLGNSRQRCCQGCGTPSSYACSSQAWEEGFSLSRSWLSPVPHCPSNTWNLTTNLLQQLNGEPRTASCCSPLLIRVMKENCLLIWGNLSQNSPAKPFHFLSLKINKSSASIINNLVENRSHLLMCHILCSGICGAGEDAFTDKGEHPK